MTPADRSISRCQVASRTPTCRTPPRSSIAVALSTAAPTAERHANRTFSLVSGAFLRIAASAPDTSSLTGTMGTP
jgi:hypothetical protein